MLSSMAARLPHRHGRRARTRARRLTALVVAGCLIGAIAGTASAAGAGLPECATQPAGASVMADVPWPQQRYDLAALSQITDGSGVTIAVIDSGVDGTHPQLAHAVASGTDVLDRRGDGRLDCVGHGTAVASIIAARPMAGTGLRGVAPGARILPVRVNERVGTDGAPAGDGDVTDLAAGIRAAVASRPKPAVINLSISTRQDNAALRAAVAAALDADIVVVAAVGNRHPPAGMPGQDPMNDPVPYPASYDGVVGVGAIGPDGRRVATSQIGSYVDIVAPGDVVVGAAPRRGHLAYQGTSFAAPFVAATAALVRARWPHLDRAEVVRRLLATADPGAGTRPSADYGHGVLNPRRALTEVLAPVAPTRTTAPTPAVASVPVAPWSVTSAGGGRTWPTPRALVIAAILLVVAAGVAIAGGVSAVAAVSPRGRTEDARRRRLRHHPL